MAQSDSILVHGTHGSEDPEKALLPFIVGNVSATSDKKTIVFLTSEGVRLATKGYASIIAKEGLPDAEQLLSDFVSNGGEIWACGVCTKPRGITPDDLIEGAKIVTAVNLVEAMLASSAVISF